MVVLLVGLGGFAGAIARFWLGGYVAGKVQSNFPWGTLIVNVTGAFALGLVFGLEDYLSPSARLAMGTGFLGAYTTFSTFSLETIRLMMSQEYWLAGFYVGLSILGGLFAAALGIAVGGGL